MTPREWSRFAGLWMRDDAFREAVEGGRLDALSDAGFELDDEDRAMLGGFCTLARDTGAVNHMLRGPWVWAAVDGPVCEALAKFETVSTPGNSTPQFESWGAKLGNALISAPGGGADPFSALRKRHIASALLVKRPHVFNTPWDIRCTSAWSATDAAEAYHGALSSFIGMPGNGMPATPPAADDMQFWDLVWG